MALNAKNGISIADHEGYHYAEDRMLDGSERAIVANAFKPGRPLFEKLMESVRRYDRENNTNLAGEVSSIPAEARASSRYSGFSPSMEMSTTEVARCACCAPLGALTSARHARDRMNRM